MVADSGIGRAVAIAFAREGADMVIAYYNEDDDAKETARWVEQAGRRAVLAPGDIKDPEFCAGLVARTVSELGGIDILVNNAAHQMSFESLDDITPEEWDITFRTNIREEHADETGGAAGGVGRGVCAAGVGRCELYDIGADPGHWRAADALMPSLAKGDPWHQSLIWRAPPANPRAYQGVMSRSDHD